ncbi:hypothetical protein CKA38_13265 [Ereboglobus luteus]|uniref:Uncharacterized protein n=2 Tax=Ereboglobus luteus TaxID=1796921 RepID=A0A2U8E5J1_9BACT|nr:hypothetical protein CKA38_13265 [Ereboglobus luteus]
MIFPRVQVLAVCAVLVMALTPLPDNEGPKQANAQPQPAPSNAGKELQAMAPAPVPQTGLNAGADDSALAPDRIGGLSIVHPSVNEYAPTPRDRVTPTPTNNVAHQLPGSAAYSPNWLVDGMAQLEADEKRQKEFEARFGRREDGSARDALNEKSERDRDIETNLENRNAVAANDPLVQYLQKWADASPAAAGIAAAAQNAVSGDTPPNAGGVVNAADAGAGDAPSNMSPRAAGGADLAAMMGQPMLEATGPSIVLPPPPPVAPAETTFQGVGDQPSAPVVTGIPEHAALKIKPIEKDTEPTRPIVNDKKYFPQLQRF